MLSAVVAAKFVSSRTALPVAPQSTKLIVVPLSVTYAVMADVRLAALAALPTVRD